MSRNLELSQQPATKSDVADIAIDTCVALYQVLGAIQALQKDRNADISEPLEHLARMADSLDKRFNKLTGWTNES